MNGTKEVKEIKELNELKDTNNMGVTNIPILFDLEKAVEILDRIESFNPRANLRKIEGPNGTTYYLDTKDRIDWFKKTFPYSKIYKIPREITDTHATFEVRVYVDRNDPVENFLANGFATRYKDETNPDYGVNFVESAETAALGRALRDAGFGTQSCGMDINVSGEDEQLVDAGVSLKNNSGSENTDTVSNGTNNEGTKKTVPASVSPEVKTGESKPENTTTKETSKEELKPIVLTKDMEVEELVKLMSVDYAEKLVVDYGADSGKTLGFLNRSKPASIEYHAACSKNNLIKAGALVLIAEKKKSA